MLSEVNDHNVVEARQHVRVALDRLNKFDKSVAKKEQQSITQSEAWWGDVIGGVAQGFHSQEAWSKSLEQLQNMLNTEKTKLQELEDTSKNVNDDKNNVLLND
jgi:RNA binding exosome subunit